MQGSRKSHCFAVFSARSHFAHNSALRTFRRRTSYARRRKQAQPSFQAQQSLCAPAIRPCGLSGVEHLMLPRQQALRCFRRRSHFPTGPAEASNILCSPDNRLCRVFGAAIRCSTPESPPCGLSGVEHLAAPLKTTGLLQGSFRRRKSLCGPAIRPCGLSGVEHLMLP